MKYLKSIIEFLETQIENENVGYVKPSIDNELDLDNSEENDNIQEIDENEEIAEN